MNDQNQPMDFNPGPTPTPGPTLSPAKKNNTALIIAIIVVVVLCCCCVAVAGGWWLWNHGDKLIQQGTGTILQML
ncbi:MAG: hypothetical protein WCA79_07690 [Anaerolineales bacterium]